MKLREKLSGKTDQDTLESYIYEFLERSGVSFTTNDIAEIQTMYLNKYGHAKCED